MTIVVELFEYWDQLRLNYEGIIPIELETMPNTTNGV